MKKYCIDCKKVIDKRSMRCCSCHVKFMWKNKLLKVKTGILHNFYGKNHTEETKNKIRKSEYHKNLKGKNNPMFGKKRPDLSNYNKLNNCLKNQYAERNPSWKGGISKLPYSFKFDDCLKLKIRIRDNFKCQNCEITEEEHLEKYNRALDIHHIDYNKQNCKEDNLISLCRKCNVKANHNRDYWFAYYTYLIERILI